MLPSGSGSTAKTSPSGGGRIPKPWQSSGRTPSARQLRQRSRLSRVAAFFAPGCQRGHLLRRSFLLAIGPGPIAGRRRAPASLRRARHRHALPHHEFRCRPDGPRVAVKISAILAELGVISSISATRKRPERALRNAAKLKSQQIGQSGH